jgi:hypothetical protein
MVAFVQVVTYNRYCVIFYVDLKYLFVILRCNIPVVY